MYGSIYDRPTEILMKAQEIAYPGKKGWIEWSLDS